MLRSTHREDNSTVVLGKMLTYITDLLGERWSRVIARDELPCAYRPVGLKLFIREGIADPNLDVVVMRCCEDEFLNVRGVVRCLGPSILPLRFGGWTGDLTWTQGTRLFLWICRGWSLEGILRVRLVDARQGLGPNGRGG